MYTSILRFEALEQTLRLRLNLVSGPTQGSNIYSKKGLANQQQILWDVVDKLFEK
jgi:hypothetical protein